MNRTQLEKMYSLHPPVTASDLTRLEHQWPGLPDTYRQFLHISDGLESDGFTLLSAEVLPQRNRDYEVNVYLPTTP